MCLLVFGTIILPSWAFFQKYHFCNFISKITILKTKSVIILNVDEFLCILVFRFSKILFFKIIYFKKLIFYLKNILISLE